MRPLRDQRPSRAWRALALAFALPALALASATPQQAIGAAGKPATTSSTPTLPVPASAKAQPSTGGAAATTKAPGGVAAGGGTAGTPATSATPTTTYVPSGGATPAPSAVPNGSVATSPTATTSPTIPSTPTIASGQVSPGQAALPGRTRAAARPGKKHLSTTAIVIAALGALLALGCAAWGLARRRAFEPHWWLSLRHATAEAGFRASATWAEFTDWARLGH